MFIKIKNKVLSFSKNEYVRVFGLLYLIGFIIFSTEAIPNLLRLPINGDYILQTYPFYADGYDKMWNFFTTGNFPMFDFSNFLGANYIGANTFYYLTSPLFYILLLFPKSFLYQGIYLLLLFKLAMGGLLFYILLKKFFHLTKKTSLLGAIIYSFSGWTMYYLWFQFADVVAFFPLILLGIEYVLLKRKGWLLTLSLFLMGMANFFFLFTFSIVCVFYALARYFQFYFFDKKNQFTKHEKIRALSVGITYYFAGILLASVVLIPSFIVVLQTSRSTSSLMLDFLKLIFTEPSIVNGSIVLGAIKPISQLFHIDNFVRAYQFFFVWPIRQVGGVTILPSQTISYILSQFFIINTECWSNAVFHIPNLDNNIGGLFITTPLTILLIPSIIYTFKSKKRFNIAIMILAIIMPFIPGSFYLFHGFTFEYGRWLLFIVAISLIFILTTYDRLDQVKKWYLDVGIVINLLLVGFTIYTSYQAGLLDTSFIEFSFFGLIIPLQIRVLIIVFQLLYMIVIYLCYRNREKIKDFKDKILFAVFIEILIMATLTMSFQGVAHFNQLWNGPDLFKEEEEIIRSLEKEDSSFYRIFSTTSTRNYPNYPMTQHYNGLSTFQSIYNFELQDFIDRSKIDYNGSWVMGVHEKRNYLDQFLGVKYYIINKTDLNNDGYLGESYNGDLNNKNYQLNIPFNFSLYQESKNFLVYKNDTFIELGFVYDDFISSSTVGYRNDSIYYEDLYQKMAIVNKEDLNEITLLLNKEPKTSHPNSFETISTFHKKIELRQDCSEGICGQVKDPSKINEMKRATHDFVGTSFNEYLQNPSKMMGRWGNYNFRGDTFQLDIPSNQYACKSASKTNPCFASINFKMGPNVLISLYNNEQLITQDAHMVHTYGISAGESKEQRGFYVDQPFNRVRIEFINDTDISYFNLNNFKIQYRDANQFYSDYQNRTQFQLKNITYSPNRFTFTTDFQEKKLISLNIPYDAGWSLSKNNEPVKIYKLNGGFIGLISDAGNSSYSLDYTTPGLKTGALFTSFGLLYLLLISLYFNRKELVSTISSYRQKKLNREK